MPPKYLEIEHDGLAHFSAPGYATSMIRKEELNVDMDAEGGMSLNMVGIPGYHNLDDSGKFNSVSKRDVLVTDLGFNPLAITAPAVQPVLEAADLVLLQTPAQLRKGAPKETNVSFLRRTQYISAAPGAGRDMGRNTVLRPKTNAGIRKPGADEERKNDPRYIKKYIQKGFDIAYPESKHTGPDEGDNIAGLPATKAEMDAWNKPVHPTNPRLKLVDSYPILPDLDAFTDTGGLIVFKFDKPPVAPLAGNKRDPRPDVSLLQPLEPAPKIQAAWENKMMLHRTDPTKYPDPGPQQWDYNLFLPDAKKPNAVSKIQAQFNLDNPNGDSEEAYTHSDPRVNKHFNRYDFVRRYATSSQTLHPHEGISDIALTLVDPFSTPKSNPGTTSLDTMVDGKSRHVQKGAFYTKIISRSRIAPERSRMLAGQLRADDPDRIDQLHVQVRDPLDDEVYKRATHRAQVDMRFGGFLQQAEKEDEEVELRRREGSAGSDEDEVELVKTSDRNGKAVADADADADDDMNF